MLAMKKLMVFRIVFFSQTTASTRGLPVNAKNAIGANGATRKTRTKFVSWRKQGASYTTDSFEVEFEDAIFSKTRKKLAETAGVVSCSVISKPQLSFKCHVICESCLFYAKSKLFYIYIDTKGDILIYDTRLKLRLTDKAKCNHGSQTHETKVKLIYNFIEPHETNALKNDLN